VLRPLLFYRRPAAQQKKSRKSRAEGSGKQPDYTFSRTGMSGKFHSRRLLKLPQQRCREHGSDDADGCAKKKQGKKAADQNGNVTFLHVKAVFVCCA